MVMSFTMKKLLIYEKEEDMETGGPITTYEFRYDMIRGPVYLLGVGREDRGGCNKKEFHNILLVAKKGVMS